MPVARIASATTSLPNAGAFTPAGTGRSRAAISASEVVGFFVRVTDIELHAPSFSGGTIGGKLRRKKPKSVRLAQARAHLQAGIPPGRVHADLLLERGEGAHGVRAGAPVDAVGLEAALV